MEECNCLSCNPHGYSPPLNSSTRRSCGCESDVIVFGHTTCVSSGYVARFGG